MDRMNRMNRSQEGDGGGAIAEARTESRPEQGKVMPLDQAVRKFVRHGSQISIGGFTHNVIQWSPQRHFDLLIHEIIIFCYQYTNRFMHHYK